MADIAGTSSPQGRQRDRFGPHLNSTIKPEDITALRELCNVPNGLAVEIPTSAESPELVILGLATLAIEESVALTATDVLRLVSVKSNKRYLGTFYFSPKPDLGIIAGLPSRDGWHEKYFFFEANRLSIGSCGLLPTRWSAVADTQDKIRSDAAFRSLVQNWRSGRMNWTTFDRRRIFRALGPVVGGEIPIVPVPLTIQPPAVQLLVPASSSSASTPANTSRRQTFCRSNQSPAESSRMVRAGKISTALMDIQVLDAPSSNLPILRATETPILALTAPIAVSSNESGENSNAHPSK